MPLRLLLAVGVVLSLTSCVTPPFQTGLEVLKQNNFQDLTGRKIGIVTNHTAVDSNFTHIVDLVHKSGQGEIVALFGPEHGVRGSAQAGDKVGDDVDPITKIPIYSLYGKTRKPDALMLRGVDLLIYDIQDIGVRTYTYLSTLLGVMEVASELGIEVWVLDRPNPLGLTQLEGPMLKKEFESFVGPHTLPLRYGLTVGEYAKLVAQERSIELKLKIIPEPGTRQAPPAEGKPGTWIAPSPNIPTRESALVYVGIVLIEGTNLSEGRGTTKPFQWVGAPWLNVEELIKRMDAFQLPGVSFRPVGFKPTFSKFQGEACRGIELHITNENTFTPALTAILIIHTIHQLHPNELTFREQAMAKLAGTDELLKLIQSAGSNNIKTQATNFIFEGVEAYRRRASKFSAYSR